MKETASYVQDVLTAQAEAEKARLAYEKAHVSMMEAQDKMYQTSRKVRESIRDLGGVLPNTRVVQYNGKSYYLNAHQADPVFTEAGVTTL